jgi:hypothetical protein
MYSNLKNHLLRRIVVRILNVYKEKRARIPVKNKESENLIRSRNILKSFEDSSKKEILDNVRSQALSALENITEVVSLSLSILGGNEDGTPCTLSQKDQELLVSEILPMMKLLTKYSDSFLKNSEITLNEKAKR